MTQLANKIASTAIDWLKLQCYEQTSNRGTCIDKIHEYYDASWIDRNTSEAYCAEFVSVVLQKAFQEFGQDAPIFTASAIGILNDARARGITVDTTSAVGAVFYKKSSSATSSGHVGIIVEELGGGYFNTVEGNATDPTTGQEGVVSIKRSTDSDSSIRIIHVETLIGGSATVIAGTSKPLMVLLVAAAIGFLYTRNKQAIKDLGK